MLLYQSSWNQPEANQNPSLSFSTHLGRTMTLVCDSLQPSSAWGPSRSSRRNLVCFAKSGQVDRLPLPRLIPTVIFNRCHCSWSPGSEPGFRCERQAGCQVLFAFFHTAGGACAHPDEFRRCSLVRHYTTSGATRGHERRFTIQLGLTGPFAWYMSLLFSFSVVVFNF